MARTGHIGIETQSQSDWSLSGQEDYEHFGSSIAFASGSLYIGAPGYRQNASEDMTQGRIYGYEMNGGGIPSLKFTLTSEDQYSGFGTSMAVGDFYGYVP